MISLLVNVFQRLQKKALYHVSKKDLFKLNWFKADFPLLKLAPGNQYLALADWKGDIIVLSVVGQNILTTKDKFILPERNERNRQPVS